MADAPESGPREIKLVARQDVNVNVDLKARVCVFHAVHPDGLLDHYAVVIPINQLKRIAGFVIMQEGKNEQAALQQQAEQRRIRLT